jgi:Tfp pilus assembly protein PilO
VNLSEKKYLYIAASTLGVIGLSLSILYLSTVKKVKKYQAANIELLAANAASSAKIKSLNKLNEDIERLKLEVKDFNDKVPQGPSHGIFLEKLASAMQTAGLNDLVIQPGTETVENGISCIPLKMSGNGKTDQVFYFLKSMEQFKRIINVEDAVFKNSQKYDGTISMQIDAKIFYMKEQ